MRVLFGLVKFSFNIIQWGLILAFLILALSFWAIKIEPHILTVKKADLYLPNWDKKLDGFKVVVLGDFHISAEKTNLKRLKKIAQKTNAQKPDLVLLLGDFDVATIKESGINKQDIVKVLGEFEGRYGVFSVLGNHDIKPPGIIRKMLEDAGIAVLDNENTHIMAQNKRVNIIGIKDWWHYENEIKRYLGRISISSPTLLLSHNPDAFYSIPENTSLTLAAHTHGGQIYLPLLGGLFVPSVYGQKFVKGYVVENNKHIYITSGVGDFAPARFGNIPEIVVLRLYSQDGAENTITETKPNSGIEVSLMPKYLKFLNSEMYEKYVYPFYERVNNL